MTESEIGSKVLKRLGDIAPEADPAQLATGAAIRDQLDIDSMDFLNFMLALHKEFDIEIPERDYSMLQTLDGCVAYVARSLNVQAKAP
jgi:acyl carrier protein